jgi:mRNA interferase MazF
VSEAPLQGEVIWADPEPIRGREQAKPRPFLVVSVDSLNRSPLELVLAVPLTTSDFGNALHVPVDPPEGGVRHPSFVMPEQLRAMSRDRFGKRLGSVRNKTLLDVLKRCRLLLRDPR